MPRESLIVPGPYTIDSSLLTAKPESFLGVLPNGIKEYQANYAADTVSKEAMSRMREEEAKIWALGNDEAGVWALVRDREKFIAFAVDQTPEGQELRVNYDELDDAQKYEAAQRMLRVEGFRSQSLVMRKFSEKATTYFTMECLYTLGEFGVQELIREYKESGRSLSESQIEHERRVTGMWFGNFNNAAAVRERGKVVRVNIIEAARETHRRNPDQPVIIGSIACGSSFVVLEAMKQLKDEGIATIGHMIDRDVRALAYTKHQANEMGLEAVNVIAGDVVRLNGEFSSQQFHVLESDGIVDYFRTSLATPFLGKNYSLLKPGGTMVASNVMENPERPFLHGGVGWENMFYRDPLEFSNLFISGRVGFQAADCKSIRIPNQLYTMVVAKKPLL